MSCNFLVPMSRIAYEIHLRIIYRYRSNAKNWYRPLYLCRSTEKWYELYPQFQKKPESKFR